MIEDSGFIGDWLGNPSKKATLEEVAKDIRLVSQRPEEYAFTETQLYNYAENILGYPKEDIVISLLRGVFNG
ncbi:hypothetical protein LCGC14_1499550 [marine sediment metagenome]|uniref:Uncharacterized protein n=1 Tax=marine sediment metagenome TaxID=412755 RepID=A0A0F9J501_9ZZZZ